MKMKVQIQHQVPKMLMEKEEQKPRNIES
uniref:Uncharacterized protein n=1 Tax=Rhizophora mucronata TaxID=61149 RepID=A0A2P2P386_RHIMU